MFQTWNRQRDVVMKDIIRCGGVVFRKELFKYAQVKSVGGDGVLCIFGCIDGMGDKVAMYSSLNETEIWRVFNELIMDLGVE